MNGLGERADGTSEALVPRPAYPFRGSAGPLSHADANRNVLRTGWGPRGDSGPARGRVRATQPAKFLPSKSRESER